MEPLTWVYLALLAASTAASAKAQQKTNKARAKVQAEDTARRKKQQQDAEAAALKTQDSYFNQTSKTAEREAELADMFAPKEATAPTTDTSGTRFLSTDAPTGSTRTVEASQQEQAKGRARASQRATSMAQLGAFNDMMRTAGLEAGRNAQDIGISASNLQGWTANVLPALYAKANVAGKDWATAGDVMKLVAAVMAPAALGGAGGATAAGTGAGGGAAANTTSGVLSQMAGTPAEFVGAFPAMTGTGFAGASAAGLGGAGAASAGAVPMFTDAFETDLLRYLNDPTLWKGAAPQHWNYYRGGL
jgi:hypothetical protein